MTTSNEYVEPVTGIKYLNTAGARYKSSTETGGATADNTVVYQSDDVSIYNYHAIENTSTTDPVDVYVSLDGTNYATAAASAVLQDDVTTGGGIAVITIPVGKVGVVSGRYKKIKVLKDGATAETPSARIAHY